MALALEQRERIAVVVRRQAGIRAEPVFVDQTESAPLVERDERRVAPPSVHAEALASQRHASLVSPCEDRVHQAAPGIVRGSGNAMEIQMRASLVRPPYGGIFVRDGEHADDSVVERDAKETPRFDLGENGGVGEFRPDDRALFPLHGSAMRIGGTNAGKVTSVGRIDSHVDKRWRSEVARIARHKRCHAEESRQLGMRQMSGRRLYPMHVYFA
jgi:hypothetical protein